MVNEHNKNLLESEHLIVKCELQSTHQIISSHCLIDCGATGIAFVHESFPNAHNLPLTRLKEERALEVIDG